MFGVVLLAIVVWIVALLRARREVPKEMGKRGRAILSWSTWLLIGCCAATYLVRDFESVASEVRTGMLLVLGILGVARGIGRPRWLPVAGGGLMFGALVAMASRWHLAFPIADRHLFLLELLTCLVVFLTAVWLSARERGVPGRVGLHACLEEVHRGVSVTWLVVAVSTAALPSRYWQESTAQHACERAALLLTLGLAAAVSWLRANSLPRSAATLAMLGLAALISWYLPPNAVNQEPTPCTRFLLAVPALLAALWLGLDSRLSTNHRGSNATAVVFGFLAVLVFARANFIQPRISVIQSVISVEKERGTVLWQTDVFEAASERVTTYRTSQATPTPCSNGQVVVAHFGNGTAGLALDGDVLWKHEHPGFSDAALYGAGSSPVIAGNSVIIVQGRESTDPSIPSFAVAYRLRDGVELWRSDRPDARGSYGTPLVLETGGATELVMPAWGAIVAHDATTGHTLWSRDVDIEEVVPSAVEGSGMLFVAGGSMRSGVIGLQMPGNAADRMVPEIVWGTARSVPSCCSPVLYRDQLYTVSDGGVMTCFEARTGVVLWRERIASGEYYASLAAGDGKVYATNAEGTTTVLAAASEFSVLAENHLGEPVFASPALEDGAIFMRGNQHLYRLDGIRRDGEAPAVSTVEPVSANPQ